MSAPALSLAFFDPVSGLHGTARSGMTLLFEGSRPQTHAEPPELVAEPAGGYRARLEGRFELEFEPVSEPATLGESRAVVCRVGGSVLGRRVDCLGTASETLQAPSWRELDALRVISALFDSEHAVLALARRPRGAIAHGQELVSAHLLSGGELLGVEEARISTVYDANARQRSAGLELWMPGEDFPRRASGSAIAGASLALEGLDVHAAVFAWHMEGREGVGAYELASRTPAPAAA